MYEYLNKIIEINDRLDNARKIAEKNFGDVITPADILGADYSICDKISKELDDYLHSLNYDDIKIVKTIMLLGTPYHDISNNHLKGMELLQDELEYGERVIGFRGKDNDIYYIISKAPLSEYLRKGIELLNIID